MAYVSLSFIWEFVVNYEKDHLEKTDTRLLFKFSLYLLINFLFYIVSLHFSSTCFACYLIFWDDFFYL